MFARLALGIGLLATLAGGVARAQPAAPLTSRQLDNLVAFTRVAGAVRYFYPSRAASRVAWPAFYLHCLPGVLRARSARALADTLRRDFALVAPAVTFGSSPPLPGVAAGVVSVGYRWQHRGLGLDRQGLGLLRPLLKLAHLPYASTLGLDTTRHARQLPATHTLSLTDSLAATVPLVLPPAQALAPVRFSRRGQRLHLMHPLPRLVLLMQAWNIVQHFYPYRQQLTQANWPMALRQGLQAAYAAPDGAAALAAGQVMLAPLADRHISFVRRTRTGLHVQAPDFSLAFELLPDNRVVVARAAPTWQWPAGSVLEQVNGQPIGRVLDSLQAHTSAATPAVARQLAARHLLARFWKTSVRIRLTVRAGATEQERVLTFRQLRQPPSRAAAFRQLPGQLLYLDGARLQYAEFQRLLPALQRARGLVVDLRQRPTYAMREVLTHWTRTPLAADLLLTPILPAPDFAAVAYDTVREHLPARLPYVGRPTVFLIGPDTYSYGETLVSLIKRHHLGLLLGEPTGGTNGEMNFASLGRCAILSWTGRRVLSPAGRTYQGQGISPDLPAPPTLASIEQQQDAALQLAMLFLLDTNEAMKAAGH